MSSSTIEQAVLIIIVILPALTWHEFAHAYVADKLGDPTPRMNGRLTLNPIAHIDLFGTIILPLLLIIGGLPGFGYAKPVPINPYNFRDARRGSLLTGAAGPVSNLVQGVVVGLILRGLLWVAPVAMLHNGLALTFLFWLTAINFILAIFNLIPLGPLDGHHILEALLTYDQLVAYRKFNQYGFFIVLAIVFFLPRAGMIIFTPAMQATHLLTGIY